MWEGAAGISTGDLPMKVDLLMAIGSVTKVYTAALILDLVDEGVLSLDDPLTKWVADAVNADGVTIRHLLNHTSGIASDDPGLQPVCEPGACHSYSNAGYAYLGAVIERATASDYAHVLRERLTSPLGLNATFFPRQEPIGGEPAMGHLGAEEAIADDAATIPQGPGSRGASGGIVATAADVARLGHALFTGSALSTHGLEAMLDFEATAGLPGSDECSAQAVLIRRGGEFGESWSHGGNTGYFRAWLEHYPRYGATIAVLVNADVVPVPLVERLARAALSDERAAPNSEAMAGRCEVDVAVRAADGTVRRVSREVGFDGMPSWSPDGGSLVWIGERDGQTDVVVGDAAGSTASPITNDPAHDVLARWSPDGSAIAYSSDIDGDSEIYLIAPDGTRRRQLTENDTADWMAAWSPDGSRIAYVSADGRQHLRVASVDGSDDRPVAGAVDEPWWPTWSPDGTRIAYESRGAIYVIPVGGGDPRRLPIPQLRVTRFPAWAPGADILFVSDGDLYTATEDGSNLRRLTRTSTSESTPAWAPDGSSIAFELSHWTRENDR
jgi:Tol biopolymer transport system component/CubicO group peptidase (beta-lactamase class C family)